MYKPILQKVNKLALKTIFMKNNYSNDFSIQRMLGMHSLKYAFIICRKNSFYYS